MLGSAYKTVHHTLSMSFRPRFISPLSMLAQNVPSHEGLRGIEYRNALLSPINRQRARNVRISGVMTRSAVGLV